MVPLNSIKCLKVIAGCKPQRMFLCRSPLASHAGVLLEQSMHKGLPRQVLVRQCWQTAHRLSLSLSLSVFFFSLSSSICIHIYIHTYIHTYIHIYIYIYRAHASPFGRAPLLRTPCQKRTQKCSSNISDEYSCFIDFLLFHVCLLPPFFPLSLDIPKPKLCPNGDASGA